jgi:hypothetical protein
LTDSSTLNTQAKARAARRLNNYKNQIIIPKFADDGQRDLTYLTGVGFSLRKKSQKYQIIR